MLNSSNNFSAPIKITLLLYFCNVVNYIDFQMLNQPSVPGPSVAPFLYMSRFNVLIFIQGFYTHVYKKY